MQKIILWSLCCLAACSTPAPKLSSDSLRGPDSFLGECLDTYKALDSHLELTGRRDGQAHLLEDYPFLRVNRFLSSFRNELDSPEKIRQWLERMSQLDHSSRLTEIARIPAQELKSLSLSVKSREELYKKIDNCASLMTETVIMSDLHFSQIRQQAVVPDDYSIFKRTVGLYPLAAVFFLQGVKDLHEETRDRFSPPLSERLPDEAFLRYGPAHNRSANELDIVSYDDKINNPLSIPEVKDTSLSILFQSHAPIWEIETQGYHDFLGVPVWQPEHISVDIRQPVSYTYHTFARFKGDVLLQLNYVIWFPARPLKGPFDLLGGHIDGITWRVTLDKSGDVLFYDSIHNCGCYHLIFPGSKIVQVPNGYSLEEPLLAPQRAPELKQGERVVITLNTGAHYLSGLRTVKADKIKVNTHYVLRDYSILRMLETTGEGRVKHSMFDVNGLVPGTERKERWLFWPMGIAEPGAMRQRGRHAIAFVGRRHFDDPYLLEKNFIINKPGLDQWE